MLVKEQGMIDQRHQHVFIHESATAVIAAVTVIAAIRTVQSLQNSQILSAQEVRGLVLQV